MGRKIKVGIGENNLWLWIIIWCIVYAVTVCKLLPDYYYVGNEKIILYGKHFSMLRMVIALPLVLITYYITKISDRDNILLNYTKSILYLFFTVPAILMYALFEHPYSTQFLVYCLLYWMMFCFFSYYMTREICIPKVVCFKEKYQAFLIAIFILVLLGYSILKLGGVNISLTLKDVYTSRASFKENSSDLIVIIKTVMGDFICPVIITKALTERKYLLSFIGVMGQIVAFSFAKDKTYLIMLIVALALGFVRNSVIERFDYGLSIFLKLMSVVGIVGCFGILVSFFEIVTRRVFIIPTWLQYLNFEYFIDKPKTWWRQDIFLIDKLFTPIYPDSLTTIISNVYLKGAVPNPNVGMTGESFTRFGYVGLIIYPILIVLLLKYLYKLIKSENKQVILVFAVSLSMLLSNDVITSTSFVGTMVIFSVFCLLLYKKPKSL